MRLLLENPDALVYDPLTQREEINRALRGQAGIYLWYNLETGDYYVGSSKCLTTRLRSYFNSTVMKRSKVSRIYNAIAKYGLSSLKLIILAYAPALPVEELLTLEQFFIDTMNPAYNISPTAGSNVGFKHSAETKAIMGAKKKGKLNPNYGGTCPITGKSLTDEQRAEMSARMKGNKINLGRKHTQDTKAKMSSSQKGNVIHNITKGSPCICTQYTVKGLSLLLIFLTEDSGPYPYRTGPAAA